MNINLPDFPFTFNPEACQECQGKCCRWGGYVWVTEEEIVVLAEAMNLSLEAFAEEYVKACYGRLSLQDRLREGEYQCALFDPSSHRCLVYAARPVQCRTFPFWEQYREDYRQLLEFCPGVKETLAGEGKDITPEV
jgi:Fe-S-cluster containining protein